jgi:hypothetical protein
LTLSLVGFCFWGATRTGTFAFANPDAAHTKPTNVADPSESYPYLKITLSAPTTITLKHNFTVYEGDPQGTTTISWGDGSGSQMASSSTDASGNGTDDSIFTHHFAGSGTYRIDIMGPIMDEDADDANIFNQTGAPSNLTACEVGGDWAQVYNYYYFSDAGRNYLFKDLFSGIPHLQLNSDASGHFDVNVDTNYNEWAMVGQDFAHDMFSQSGLTTLPSGGFDFPDSLWRVGPGFCASMFAGDALTELPQDFLFPDIQLIANDFCAKMFAGCTALGQLPDSFTIPSAVRVGPDDNLYDDFCQSMFDGCTALSTLPAGFGLPQENVIRLGKNYCRDMFNGCSALESLPDNFQLPAILSITGASFCQEMFKGCSALKNLPEGFNLPENIKPPNPAAYSTSDLTSFCQDMFSGCRFTLETPIDIGNPYLGFLNAWGSDASMHVEVDSQHSWSQPGWSLTDETDSSYASAQADAPMATVTFNVQVTDVDNPGVTVNVPYQIVAPIVSFKVHKDAVAWTDCPNTFVLCAQGDTPDPGGDDCYSSKAQGDGSYQAAVPDVSGTSYEVYTRQGSAGAYTYTDTHTLIETAFSDSGDPSDPVVNYYTVSWQVTPAGTATSAQVSATYTYDGAAATTLATGTPLLAGSKVTLTASGSGADTYTYKWSPASDNLATLPKTLGSATLFLDGSTNGSGQGIAAKADLQVTVTGADANTPTPEPQPTPPQPTPPTPQPTPPTPTPGPTPSGNVQPTPTPTPKPASDITNPKKAVPQTSDHSLWLADLAALSALFGLVSILVATCCGIRRRSRSRR